jgi:hypothetical protein
VKRPDPKIFRALGYVSIAAAVLLLALFLANLRSRIHYGGPNLAALGWMALYAAIVGWGSFPCDAGLLFSWRSLPWQPAYSLSSALYWKFLSLGA